MMSKYMVEKWERKKQTSSCSMERGRTEESKVVRNRLMWITFLPPRAMLMSEGHAATGAIPT